MAIYYVDKTTGSDSDTGLTEELAWETINKVNISSFNAGDSILFKKGEIWREQLTVPDSGSDGSPITFGAYGSGADPIISGADLIAPGSSWSAYQGAWATSWSSATSGWSDQSTAESRQYRNVYNNADLSTSGTRVRVSLLGHSTLGSSIDGVSIGPRSGSSDDMASGPTRITFDTGSSTVAIGAGAEKVSDEMTYTLDAGVDQLLHVYLADQADLVFKSLSGGTYYDNAAPQDDTMNATWTSDGASGNLRSVFKVEVRTPTANVWQATLTTEPSAVFFDGAWGTEESSIGNLDAALEWFWEANVLYVYSASDPDTLYTSPGVEVSQRDRCVYADDESYITIDGLEVVRANESNIEVNGDSDNWIIQNVTSEYAYFDGIYIYEFPDTGDEANDGLIDGCTVRYNAGNGIHLRHHVVDWTVSSNIASYNCLLEDDGDRHDYTAGIRFVGTAGSGHTATQNTVERNGYTSGDVVAVSGSRGVGIWSDTVNGPDASGVMISYNYCNLNWNNGIFIENENGTKVHYNISTGHTAASVATRGIYVNTSNTSYPSKNHLIYNNVVYGNNRGFDISGVSGGGESDMCLDNTLKNNIAFGNINAELYARDGGENDGTEGSGNVYLNNCLGVEAANFVYWGDGIGKATYDAWETAYGGTTNSVEADPLFTNPGSDLFELNGNSPCLNQGTDVSLSTDFVGNSVHPTTPDIGALEWGPIYVDATSGLDTNQGTHTDYPLQTISAINGLTLGDNDQILFKKGETWREQLTVPDSGSDGSPITFGAYGSGDDPIISGSDDISGDTWSDQTGNVWRKNIGSTEPFIVIFNGSQVGGNDAATDADYEWTYSDPNLDIYAESDPNGYYSQIEAGQRLYCISIIGKSYITVDGLTCIAGNNTNIDVRSAGTSNIIIQNCTVGKWALSGRGLKFKSDIDGVGLDVNNCTIDGGVNATNQFGSDDALLSQVPGIKIYQNTISNVTDGIVLNTNDVSTYPEIYENVIYNIYDYPSAGDLPCGIDLVPTGTNLDGALVYRNLVYNSDNNSINVDSAQNTKIYANIVYGTGDNGWSANAVHVFGGADGTEIYNNTFYQSGNGIYVEGNSPNSIIKNNISVSGYRGIHVVDDGSLTGLDEDYNNCYGNSDANYEGITKGANSLESDPLFTNPGSDNFTLQYLSPCRDNGTDVSLTEDYIGTPVPQGDTEDIGAYEFLDWKYTMTGSYRGS